MTGVEQDNLATISQEGDVPAQRISTASQAKEIYDSLWRADELRAKKRQLVKGLIDGNPPYRQSDLIAEGRDYQCNVNWRVSESYVNSAIGAFYDLFGEAPTYATVRCNHGTPEQQEQYSRTMTTHFDWLLRNEPCFDYDMQISQGEMTTFGAGPLLFEDEFDWRPTSILYAQLKVPDRAKSETSRWELAAVELEYLPDKLFSYVQNPKTAASIGWGVQATRQAIINAHPDTQKGGQYKTWEWHQQELKNGSISYSQRSKTIRVVHLFYKEFPKKGEAEGKITHLIILADNQQSPVAFLFKKVGRYDEWSECIHPLYYDRGGGGFHHSVTGMGTKMFSAMEFQNRLKCNLADKAFSPKIFFRPTTATSAEQFSLQQFGDYGILADGFEAIQNPVAGLLEEGLVFDREVTTLISQNLGQYRQQSKNEKGDKPTATQVREDASKDARLQKTQMNRYYKQLDSLYETMFYRASNPDLKKNMKGGERAAEFRERCKRDGVTAECFKKIEWVRASRVVGQGSEFLRQQSVEFLFATVLARLPESGQTNLISDVIAARAGQSAVERYMPKQDESTLPSDQVARAISQVADMKTGTPAIPTETQNPLIFASVFIDSGEKALQSLQAGADPTEVASFLELSGQAAAIHLKRMAGDVTREPQFKELEKRHKALGSATDQLMQQIKTMQEAQQKKQMELRQRQQQMNGEAALNRMELEAKLANQNKKTQFGLADKARKSNQSLALQDVTTAQEMRLKEEQAETQKKVAEAKAKQSKPDKSV